ncbi:MAG: RNA polymerase sigma-70 factor [Dermatophilaceae bacterium]
MTTDPFVTHRGLLFTVAYELLGSAADAEDVVQETWLRWARVDHSEVRDPRAYLVRSVTRQSLNRLRTVSRRREEYIGEWLPEPVLTSPDVADDVVLAESVSIAMLTVLETLTPTERAVFVLHEVFDVPYDEIATAVDKSPAAVRQVAHRARAHVAARQPRMQVDLAEQHRVMERFVAAVTAGDVQGLMNVLALDVVLLADGGGVAQAVRVPVVGARKVANLLRPFPAVSANPAVTVIRLNGAVGVRVDDEAGGPTIVGLVIEDGRITRIFAMRNPDKLTRLHEETELTR